MVKIIVELTYKTQPNTFNQAVLSLMKECTFMEIESVDIVNAVNNDSNDDDKLIMNNINNLMAVDDRDDR